MSTIEIRQQVEQVAVHYWQYCETFSTRELARLKFIRWLVENERMNPVKQGK